MTLKLEFHKAEKGGFGYNALFIGVFKEKELWFQTLPFEQWYFGHQETWYDGPIKMFGLGPCEFLWHFPM